MTKRQYVDECYTAHLHYWTRLGLGVGSLVILMLIPLDYAAVPAQFRTFLLYRLVAAGIVFLLYLVNRKTVKRSLQSGSVVAAGTVVAAMVAAMVRDFHGHESPYFAGFILVAIFVAGIIPISFGASVLAGLLVYSLYLAPILAYDTITNKPYFLSANLLLLASIASLLLLQYLRARQTLKEFGVEYERRTAEEALLEREKQLAESQRITHQMEKSMLEQKLFSEGVIENSAVAIFVLDPRHRIVLWNKACEELTGVPASEMIDTDDQWRPFYDRKRPCLADIVITGDTKDLPALYSKHARSVLRAQGLQAEGWYRNLNGRDRYISFDAAPIYDSKGQLSVVIETLHDITVQKLMEEECEKLVDELKKALVEVSRSRKEWQDTFDGITDDIMIIARDYIILKTNRSFADKYGLHPQEVVGKKCYELMHGRVSPCENDCPHKAILHGRKPITQEIFAPKTNKWSRVFVYPYFSPEGELIGSIYAVKDITVEKEKERLLLMSEKFASIGQLSAGMTHEINNPINFIMVNAELLMEVWKDVLRILQRHYGEHGDFVIGGFYFSKAHERITRLFSGIVDGSHRIRNIVDSLKVFTRSKMNEPEEAVDINKVIASSLMMIESQIKKYTDSFIADVEKDLPAVKGSKYNLGQVIINLVMNALQSLPDRTRGVILLAHFDRGGARVVIEVKDEGVGMSEDVMKKAFMAFFTTKREHGGMGLGLAICHSIINDHGGSLEFDSKPGEGTTASVKLPVMIKEEKRDE